MADGSKIEWTDATWNPVTGCSIVSPGCTNCYAMKLAGGRLRNIPSRAGLTTASKAGPVWTGEVRFNEEWLTQPLKWTRPRMIFVCAHGDLFAEGVPDEWIDKVFAVMALCPQHTFQVLTKRAGRMREAVDRIGTSINYLERHAREMGRTLQWNVPSDLPSKLAGKTVGLISWPLPNVWLGVSAERQQEADERIPDLLGTPAAVRFLSAEPLLGPIKLDAFHGPDTPKVGHPMVDIGAMTLIEGLDWVIAGGESGPSARPMHPGWARSLRDQCAAADVAFFFKQWGEWAPSTPEQSRDNLHSGWQAVKAHPHVARTEELYPNAGASFVARVGKKAAGRLLDGIEHNGFPKVPA